MKVDIVFIGGGLASSWIARFLKRRHPELNIVVLEQKTDTDWNVGESTVGIAGMFMIRDLGLSTYGYLNHLPKNGLRYFFRKTNEPFDPTQCSEIGSNILPVFPTFQLDRARFDRDLWELNRQIGIEVLTGAKVLSVDIGQPHRIEIEQGGTTKTIEATWLINAGGRASRAAPVFNKLSPMEMDKEHKTAAAWGRFENVGDIDCMGDEKWKEQVGFTSRYLSTNHIMGRGYWIWVIPIDQGKVSFGVVYDTEIIKQPIATEKAFLEFLREEPLLEALLKDAKQLDFNYHEELACKRKQFCSKDRWAIVGDTFGFIDPFYSPGSDVIARQAYFVEHLVTAQDGELSDTVELINEYVDLECELLRLLYVNQYGGFGSFELYNIKSLWDFYSYTGIALWNFYSRKYESFSWLRQQVYLGGLSKDVMRSIQNGFRDLGEYLWTKGEYERKNHDQISPRQNRFRIEEKMLSGNFDDAQARQHYLHLCRLSICELLECRFDVCDLLENPCVQMELTFNEIAEFKLTEDWLDYFCQKVAKRFQEELKGLGIDIKMKIVPQDFASPIPLCCNSASGENHQKILSLWKKAASNIVKEELLDFSLREQPEEANAAPSQ